MVSIRKSKQNPDFYVVTGGGSPITVMGKTRAEEVAAARRRVAKKRKSYKG